MQDSILNAGSLGNSGIETSAYFLSSIQIDRALLRCDVRTYDGWVKAVEALLEGAPAWTGVADLEQSGFVVKGEDGDVYACAKQADGHVYSEDDLISFDRSAWDALAGCWEGTIPVNCIKVLTRPQFVALPHF